MSNQFHALALVQTTNVAHVKARPQLGPKRSRAGIGTIVGTIVGGLVMGVLNNGMSILGVGVDWQQAIKGLILLLAVVLDIYNKKKKAA